MRLRHVGIPFTNERDTHFFYSRVLELQFVTAAEETGEYIKTLTGRDKLFWMKYRTPNNDIIELYKVSTITFSLSHHIAFTVFGIEALTHKIKSYGYMVTDVMTDASQTHKVAFCQDNDGNRIELVEEL